MFTTGFQTSVVSAKNMENAIGALTANRDFLKELQQEVDGKVRMLPPKDNFDYLTHPTIGGEGYFRPLLARDSRSNRP